MGEQFCLRWNNHQNTLISVFDTLLGTETLVDCTLVAEGKFLKGHKVVLSACSPLLEMLLSQHHDKHPIVILKDIKFHELRAMMDYMYRGEVNISQDQIDTFLKAAESLQIKGLTDQGGGGDESPPRSKPPSKPPERKSPPRDEATGSPTPKRRRRPRRPSEEADTSVDTSDSCDNPAAPNFTVAVTPTEHKPPPPQDPGPHVAPQGGDPIKTKTEPPDLIQPKAEYIESLNNEDSVEDLTLDDDDDFGASQPGPSHANNSLSNQGFASWQLGGDRSNDEVFMAAQQAINNQGNTQGM